MSTASTSFRPRTSSRCGKARRLVAAAGEEVDDGHEQGGPDYRPDDGEVLAPDRDHEQLREPEAVGDPGAEQGSDEPERDGDEAPAVGAPRDRAPDGPAHGRDHEKEQKRFEGDAHALSSA